jgi:hypothetical protein
MYGIYMRLKEKKNNLVYKIWGFHSGDYEK